MSEVTVAIAHDYLTQRGGAERVVLAMARAFPEAPVFTTLYEPKLTYPDFQKCDIRTSWLNRIPLLRRSHRLALPLLPLAAKNIHINARSTIVSSSGWAHGFGASGAKIVYCHSPARWLYQHDVYLSPGTHWFKRLALAALTPFLKRWDKKQAATATKYFANSTAVQQRIRDIYNIDAEVLPAPHTIDTTLEQVPVDVSSLEDVGAGYYLCISRLLPYKNVDAVIEAFNSLRLPLVVVGSGPEEQQLRQLSGPTVLMLKDLADSELRWLYQHCTALVSSSYEDFGLTPVEAASYGKPSIVLRWGGFLDTIVEGKTGVYFDAPSPELVAKAVTESRECRWDAEVIREHAEAFSEERFAARLIRELSMVASTDLG